MSYRLLPSLATATRLCAKVSSTSTHNKVRLLGPAGIVRGGWRPHPSHHLPATSLPTPPHPRALHISTTHHSHVIERARAESGELRVSWGGTEGQEWVYPYPWLRDNCQCPQCFNTAVCARIVHLNDWQQDDTPEVVTVGGGGDNLEVVWKSGHVSTYDATWLHQRGFTKESRQVRTSHTALKKELWGRDYKVSSFEFGAVMSEEREMLKFLVQVEKFGVAVLTDAPRESKATLEIINHIGYPKQTQHGVKYDIKSLPGANSIAYTDLRLEFHTDQPYNSYTPEVIFLHCITQFKGQGGKNELVDGYFVSQYLRQHHPQEYRLLADTPVYFCLKNTGKLEQETTEYCKLVKHPVIVEDPVSGSVVRVNLSQMRDSYLDLDSGHVTSWYSALRTFNSILHQHSTGLKLNNGDILVMDNTRLFHARTGYDGSRGERHLEQIYMDWDPVLSWRRVLQEKLAVHQD